MVRAKLIYILNVAGLVLDKKKKTYDIKKERIWFCMES